MNLIWWGGRKDVGAERIWPNLKTKIKQTLCERESELLLLTCSKLGCVTQMLDNVNVELRKSRTFFFFGLTARPSLGTGMLTLLMMNRPGRGKQCFIAV